MSLFPKKISNPEEYYNLPWKEWTMMESCFKVLKQQEILINIEYFYKKYPMLSGFKIVKKSKKDFKLSNEYRFHKNQHNVSIPNGQISVTCFDKNKVALNQKVCDDFISYLNEKGYHELLFISKAFSNITRKERFNIYKHIASICYWDYFLPVIKAWELNVKNVVPSPYIMFNNIIMPVSLNYTTVEECSKFFNSEIVLNFLDHKFEIQLLKTQKFLWDLETIFIEFPELEKIELYDPWYPVRDLKIVNQQDIYKKITIKDTDLLLPIEYILEKTSIAVLSSMLKDKKFIINPNNRYEQYGLLVKNSGIIDKSIFETIKGFYK